MAENPLVSTGALSWRRIHLSAQGHCHGGESTCQHRSTVMAENPLVSSGALSWWRIHLSAQEHCHGGESTCEATVRVLSSQQMAVTLSALPDSTADSAFVPVQ
jgi:hypothetical protein